MRGYHMGRPWSGTRLEDDCPCGKGPCGLVAEVAEECDQHHFKAAKTIRQAHRAEDCPGERAAS